MNSLLDSAQAIITAHDQEQRYKGILHSTRGIVFLGTPHAGSKLATWTRYSRNIIDAATVGPSLTRKGLLKDLEQNSESLKVISESFRHRATELWITSFYERLFTMPMKGLVRSLPLKKACITIVLGSSTRFRGHRLPERRGSPNGCRPPEYLQVQYTRDPVLALFE